MLSIESIVSEKGTLHLKEWKDLYPWTYLHTETETVWCNETESFAWALISLFVSVPLHALEKIELLPQSGRNQTLKCMYTP